MNIVAFSFYCIYFYLIRVYMKKQDEQHQHILNCVLRLMTISYAPDSTYYTLLQMITLQRHEMRRTWWDFVLESPQSRLHLTRRYLTHRVIMSCLTSSRSSSYICRTMFESHLRQIFFTCLCPLRHTRLARNYPALVSAERATLILHSLLSFFYSFQYRGCALILTKRTTPMYRRILSLRR